jgi:hypothetical protein
VSQSPIKVNERTKERIRYPAALTDATQAEIVDHPVSGYAARHADEIAAGMECARAVLAWGDAAIAYLFGESIEAIERVAGRRSAST